jgi:RNA polymerase-binding transcription factor DksA
MSKLKTRKASKAAKATKAVKARKPGKALKAVRAKAPRTVSNKALRSHAVKRPAAKKPTPGVESEAVTVAKTVKWSAADLKQFRERLQRLYDIAVDTIGFLAGGRAGGVVSRMDGDGQSTDEDGTDNFVQDLALMQMSNKQDMLSDIIDAFRRLDQRTYGLCEDCGVLIAEARLTAQPFATMCIRCKSASEANRPRSQGFRKSIVQMVDSEPN